MPGMEKETAELIGQEWAQAHHNKSSEAQNRAMRAELDAAPDPAGDGQEWAILDTGAELLPIGLITENEVHILEPGKSGDFIAVTRSPLAEVALKNRETIHDAEHPDDIPGGRRWDFDLGNGRSVAFMVRWMPPQDFNRSGSFAEWLKAKIDSGDWV
jgi:hypothetical protein